MTKAEAIGFIRKYMAGEYPNNKVPGGWANARTYFGGRMALMELAELVWIGDDEVSLLCLAEYLMDKYEQILKHARAETTDIFDGAWLCMSNFCQIVTTI